MSFSLEKFVLLRPHLYHLTATTNIPRIRRTMRLESAKLLLEASGEATLVRERRAQDLVITVEGEPIHVRDQAPLHNGNMALADGWTFGDFVAYLNRRVFFWPGTAAGPISYGVRHFARYQNDAPAILRIETERLFDANPKSVALFCRYNSGSPRCSNGNKSPRSVRSFQPAAELQYSASEVVEVTFEDAVRLPQDTEFGPGPVGPWQALLSNEP